MAEQTFRSPGFFEQEIDLAARKQGPVGIPAGIAGTALKGPAFVPVTVGSFADFETKFGSLDPDMFGPYAAREFLKHRTAMTYMRVLGGGANDTPSDIQATVDKGTVRNAGFTIEGSILAGDDKESGVVKFIAAKHFISGTNGELEGYPVFSDNNSFSATADDTVDLIRGMILLATGTNMSVETIGVDYVAGLDDAANSTGGSGESARFALVLKSTTGVKFGNAEGNAGIKILTASLDPSDDKYISKILNTDPRLFQTEEHLLYADFAVENELAPVVTNASNVVSMVSGSKETSGASGDATVKMRELFGRFDTRYTTPTTPTIISQPYGAGEYNLFSFETLSDGKYANNKYKISIANLRASTDPNDAHSTFEVRVRKFGDTDLAPEILEAYPECNLDPQSDRYIARMIGDKKVRYNFDAELEDERRLVISGKYPNRSNLIRVVMNAAVDGEDVPEDVMPFGFRGIETLKTNDSLTDTTTVLGDRDGVALGDNKRRLNGEGTTLDNAIVPPLPLRFKITRGAVDGTSPNKIGAVGINERVDGRLHWGVKFERMPKTSSVDDAVLNTNLSTIPNPLVKSFTRFLGIKKLDALVTGSGADYFNDNKFTLARVALPNDLFTEVTGTAKEHMLEAAYIRNGVPDSKTYEINDATMGASGETRVTFATLVHSSSTRFNRFTEYTKFSTLFQGGFDGLNILNRDVMNMTDRASSGDLDGLATETPPGIGLKNGAGTAHPQQSGKGKGNNIVASYRTAIKLMTDPMTVNTNILCIPGMRDSYITDEAAMKTKEYSKAMYLMDIPYWSEDETRLFAGFHAETSKPDVRTTSEQFETRVVDNNYSATYFPDVWIDDPVNNRKVKVPSSVAALGALAFNDKVSYPWFAPAGFNRGGLDFVSNVQVRLSAADRDNLYDTRINPIASFPNGGFVIFGQKTLQMNKSALDRVNVRRMLLEVKRLVVGVANKLLFEQNTPEIRARFVGMTVPLLALVQAQAGIESFKVVMDDTNNTPQDAEDNKLNGRIVVVPTRAVEFIAVDFIITNSGVIFA